MTYPECGTWHMVSINLVFILHSTNLFSAADGTKPVMLAHKLYQEKPDSLPSTSDEDAAVSLQVIGLGKLDLNKLQFLHSKSRHEMIFEETVNQRVQIFSCSEVGGIRMNLGSLLVTTKFHETRPREQTAIGNH